MVDNIILVDLPENRIIQIQAIVTCNQFTETFGVRLSEAEAVLLLEARKQSLQEQERIEFGGGILPKIIVAFCDSPYIYQDNYVETLEALQGIFYLYKNESLDELSDDELIDCMKRYFEGLCQGSLEHLEDTCLEKFARNIRRGTMRFIGVYGEDKDEF